MERAGWEGGYTLGLPSWQDCRLRAYALPLGIARVSGDPLIAEEEAQGPAACNPLSAKRLHREESPTSATQEASGSGEHRTHNAPTLSSSFTHSSSASGHCPGRPAGARNPGWG